MNDVEDVAVGWIDEGDIVVDPDPDAAVRRTGQAVSAVVPHGVTPEPVRQVVARAPIVLPVLLGDADVAEFGDEEEADTGPKEQPERSVSTPPIRVGAPGGALIPTLVAAAPLLTGSVAIGAPEGPVPVSQRRRGLPLDRRDTTLRLDLWDRESRGMNRGSRAAPSEVTGSRVPPRALALDACARLRLKPSRVRLDRRTGVRADGSLVRKAPARRSRPRYGDLRGRGVVFCALALLAARGAPILMVALIALVGGRSGQADGRQRQAQGGSGDQAELQRHFGHPSLGRGVQINHVCVDPDRATLTLINLIVQNRTFPEKGSILRLRRPTVERGAVVDLDRFVNDQNIERYRRLAEAAATEAERKIMLELLAEEEAKAIALQDREQPRRA